MDITVLVALIAAIAAIIAPIVSASITSKGAHKTKSLELFFSAKSSAYEEFLSFTAKYPLADSNEDVEELYDKMSRALLYASPSTQEKITVYCQSVIKHDYFSPAYKDAILAMQADLLDM